MASVTSFIILGQSHPNDNGFGPEFAGELWEGDRPMWILRSLDSSTEPRRFPPKSPDRIFDALVELMEAAYPGATTSSGGPTGIAAVIVMLQGSSLQPEHVRVSNLSRFDVHIAPVATSRTFNRWGNDWNTSAGFPAL